MGGDGITAPAALHHGGKQLEAKPSVHGPELSGRESGYSICFSILGINLHLYRARSCYLDFWAN